MLAVLGVRVPASTLYLPPAVTPRCGHRFTTHVCPQCGIAADTSSAPSLALGFDGKAYGGYDVHRFDKDTIVIGLSSRQTSPIILNADLLMGVYVRMRDRLTELKIWGGDNFGLFAVEER